MLTIDKSAFSPEELKQYEALIAKAAVDPEAGEKKMEEEKPPFPPKKQPAEKAEFEDEGGFPEEEEPAKKSADPALTAALERLATLEKSYETEKFAGIAKKYAPLGEKEEDLAKTLYEMKKSNAANYDAYIKVLDQSLSLVEKSGLFAEIGKSAGGYSVSGPEAKAEAKAQEIMKADPNISHTAAIAKAWEDPALFAEYDSEYMG